MTGAMNKAFMAHPDTFMRTNPLEIPDDSTGTGLQGHDDFARYPNLKPAGVYDFDIVQNLQHRVCYLGLFDARTKAAGKRSHRIPAYWLPWKQSGAASMRLGEEADFFFTSALTGCRMQVSGDANPHVMHIAGDLGHEKRQELAETIPDHAASRRFSGTQYAGTGRAFFVGKAHEIRKTRRWRFYAQAISYDDGDDVYSVATLQQHHNGVLEI
jgi:hypothetical protein